MSKGETETRTYLFRVVVELDEDRWQAFAGKGLDFVTDTYLPARLSEMGVI